jgi:hypothetical protein
MGVTLTYQAIPPQSNFYSRLQQDRAFRILANFLFPYGLFIIFEYDPEEFNECMGEAIESYPDLFCGTEIETSMLIDDFREALRITCRDYPEIVSTRGSLEKSFEEVRDRLTEELSKRNFEDVDDIVANLLYGDIDFGKSDSPDEDSHALALTSRAAVKKGASTARHK